ncbi:hypothetical protein A2911_02265 [Candidatus Nomurabacteria bacterium RIFCSPLOWO2_01_FULL_40_15]|uniref:Uncharacterized protein n=1 Tax=Candidatus Nomurabacteria bacterium RIFCSPLOWO2_01_FULL_40_15 TaxID=1801772 RepID=A0A1F6X7Q2_9BACT|nr:MAG: hypothetical protein A2911_02265 [Candidatus Nomurabacteria bacterium RIFCSPLOWO2_01_FULL_40_15]
MRSIVIVLVAIPAILLLGLMSWLAGGSFPAFVAGIFLLGFAGAWIAGMAGVANYPAIVRSVAGWAALLCFLVVGWQVGKYQWKERAKPIIESARTKEAELERIRAEARARAQAMAQERAVARAQPSLPVVHGVTPAEITADYEFNLESDGPIRIKFPGVVKPVDFTPGKGCVQFPEHRSGPKKFWSPSDSSGGRVSFRLYPVKGEGCKA